MNARLTHRYLARVSVEFVTPFHIGSGRESDVSDAAVVLDANGLPTIPGSSLAGVLRAALPKDAQDRIFGFQRGNQGSGSRLSVSWACIHDSNNRPVEGIVDEQILMDPVLSVARTPALRDHVRLNHLGVADAEDRGKFDDLAVQAGHRFTFEMEMVGGPDGREDWELILGALYRADLRVGGKNRRGYGAFHVISLKSRIFELSMDMGDYSRHPVRLSESSPVLKPHDGILNPPVATSVTATLTLKPRGYWMFGGGTDVPADMDKGNADMAPVREKRVEWSGGKGTVAEHLILLPGAAIKGAISHRIAYHHNRLEGFWAGEVQYAKAITGCNNPSVRALFGYVAEDEEDNSARGKILINDVFIPSASPPPQRLTPHVSIDRFTGGALSGALFFERPFWQGDAIQLTIMITDPTGIDANARNALRLTLDDLACGMLQIGAGSGRGLGHFTAESCEWSDGGDWIKQPEKSS
ncbi:MAG TPA: RAMP superfamily CRISPR-associated protein [Kiritimatiellia bacterium]|nr:RAMP superfamily CRISPR-associated protein [Kiritimatiellia bacterium]HMO98495.1 RAMP superfamily CRISPR-associated protein [Kiritimatiellia bacterium]HMP95803.1 RAMP superfamily CRISPR-associated protein [Kiritimatiellia bacterium]